MKILIVGVSLQCDLNSINDLLQVDQYKDP